ncbi:TraI/MobA(P) family conjugative relaxase [Shewanella algae]|uniref:TraI/MobA(P) family conjugative relaxase n=1 Tax=Shewanella algae TaxID=38313 RepID=UPI001AAD85D6|nr:TraI/MobA(P) family conjugative relaxase [Shewanella algae]MBO2558933.1 relaxase/mobilization nuclease domain-containing protein [Shewanella algae]MBO2575914.1 relaxase/mobilization nuclease domain-containing protein [Shewanella algae]
MIVKHVPMKNLRKSNLSELVSYLVDSNGLELANERVGNVNITNCNSGDLEAAVLEMLATQDMNKRAKSDKTYHLIVSFPVGENLDESILNKIEDEICSGLGFKEHQRVSVVHHDTDNLHFHIAINKIHPNKLTIHEPYYPHIKLASICEDIEERYGLKKDNHIRSIRTGASKARDMEAHSGEQSLIGWIKENFAEDIKLAQSWDEIHSLLKSNGVEVKKQGAGLVFLSGGITVKASSVSRDFSKGNLEKKLGEFIGMESGESDGYVKTPKPNRFNTDKLYNDFKAEKQKIGEIRTAELQRLSRERELALDNLFRLGEIRKAVIRKVDNKYLRQFLYKQAFESKKSKAKIISDAYKSKRKAVFKSKPNLTWADWLKSEALKGNNDALAALRGRRNIILLTSSNFISGKSKNDNQMGEIDNVTKHGTILYKGNVPGLRDDGNRLFLGKSMTADGVINAVALASEKFGGSLNLYGSDKFKELVVRAAVIGNIEVSFTEPGLEARKIELKEIFNARRRSENRRVAGENGTGRGTSNNGRETSNNRTIRKRYAGVSKSKGIGRVGIGGEPHPSIRGRLLHMSSCPVAAYGGGHNASILQGNALNYMDKHETKGIPGEMHWTGLSSRLISDSMKEAAQAYVSERMEKRGQGIDVAPHYMCGKPGSWEFLGRREVDGISLALLTTPDKPGVAVLPVANVAHLKSLRKGQKLLVKADGTLSRKRVKKM